MNKTIIILLVFCVAGSVFCRANSTPSASWQGSNVSSNPKTESLYEQGIDASKSNDYQKALPLFIQALNADPNNPNILNMLAHTQRKLGNIDAALDNYKKALDLQPNFPEAREYLGEAYVQAALAELDTLKGYGDSAKGQVDDLSKSIKDAANKL